MADNLERLILADAPTLRAIAAWVSLPKSDRPGKGWVRWAAAKIYYNPQEWATAAGLNPRQFALIVSRISSMQFVGPDGEVWPPVLTLARNRAAQQIKGKGGRSDG